MMKYLLVALPVLAVLLAYALYTPDLPRAALEARYAPGGQQGDRFLAVLGLRLHLRDTGPRDAPAIILLHGFGASLLTWTDWQPALAKTHRVVSLDLPGFGLTGPDPAGDYSDARAMAVLDALMDQLGIARAAFIGNSLGGKLAWMFAALHPERVAKLVLISPDGFASPGFDYDKPAEIPALMRLLPYVLPGPLLRASIAPAFADPARLTPARYAQYRDMMLAPGVRRAILDRLAQVVLRRPEPLLRQVQAPVLLLWGEKDAMIPFTNAAGYLATLPHARLAPLPMLGHVPQEEAPALALAPVLAFLAAPG